MCIRTLTKVMCGHVFSEDESLVKSTDSVPRKHVIVCTGCFLKAPPLEITLIMLLRLVFNVEFA